MKVWLIDDEHACLNELDWLLKQYPDMEIAGMYSDSVKALNSIDEYHPDAAFLDIDMPKISGLELALSLQDKYPGIIVIFVTAYPQFALDAYKAHPLDFLLKPVRQTQLDNCISYLRKHYELLHPEENVKRTLTLRCFGTFELICETDVKWGTRRVREMLLYLINKKGSPASKKELLDALFQGHNDKNTIHNLYMTIYRLKSFLDILDPEHRMIWLTEDYALIIVPGICDFADFMRFACQNAVITEKNAIEAAHALSLYRGVYLEKESFEWIIESANEAETEYERIALGLADFHMTEGHLQEMERILDELLLRNALCEEAHILLLDLDMQEGRSEDFLRRYEQYARILKKELLLKPAVRYREHYKHLKRKKF